MKLNRVPYGVYMNKHSLLSGYKNAQKGMTFVEVLVALVIMVTGVLGGVAMQIIAKQTSFDAMQRSLATSLAQDIIERMRNNSNNLNDYATFNGGTTPTYGADLDKTPTILCNTVAAGCGAADMAINDKYEFELALLGYDVLKSGEAAGGLLGARACISNDNNAVNVIVSWQGREGITGGTTGTSCGLLDTSRRQVFVEAFIF
jgi:type IV pilus assembly protein PilV